jgi:peptidoglycan/LPS O-acetylase OafA/YrhL
MKSERLLTFDYFRGMTILLVVAGHCYNNWEIDTIAEITIANLITGATAIFVFISGFFFHFAFYHRYNYKKFIISKARNVALPYLIISTISMLGMLYFLGYITFPIIFTDNPTQQNILAYFFNLGTGRTWTAYWYVPFIMVMFALSPFFIWYIKLSTQLQIALMLICLVLSVFIQRPTLNLNPVHSAMYLTGFYMLGIMYSLHRPKISTFLDKTKLFWLLAALAVALATALLGQVGNAHKMTPWEYAGLDLMVPLKLITIPAMLSACMWLQAFNVKLLLYLAEISFGLFFVHTLVLRASLAVFFKDWAHGFMGFLVLFLTVIIISTAIIFTIRKIFKKRSRYIVGC